MAKPGGRLEKGKSEVRFPTCLYLDMDTLQTLDSFRTASINRSGVLRAVVKGLKAGGMSPRQMGESELAEHVGHLMGRNEEGNAVR